MFKPSAIFAIFQRLIKPTTCKSNEPQETQENQSEGTYDVEKAKVIFSKKNCVSARASNETRILEILEVPYKNKL